MANHVGWRWHGLLLGLAAAFSAVGCSGSDDNKYARTSTSSVPLTAGTLPGGTTIEVGITTPTNGSTVTSSSITVVGTARIGVAAPVPTDMALIMDMSGSTTALTGCGGDQNGNGRVNEILDCEIAALRALNQQAAAAGSVDRIGVGVFGANGATADVSPAAGEQLLTPPGADLDSANGLDVGQVLGSATVSPSTFLGTLGQFTSRPLDGGATSFGAGLTQAVNILGSSGAQRKFVIFVSDGFNNTGPSIGSVLPSLPAGTIVHTIAAGPSSNCAGPNTGGFGTLQQMADATGGTCTNVPDINDLPNVVPALIKSMMSSITLTLDGAPKPVDVIVPPIGGAGPASYDWQTPLTGLSAGLHEICATATGKDGGGTGSVTECVTIRVNRPPVAVCKNLSLPANGTCSAAGSVNGGSHDLDGDTITCTQVPAGPYGLGTTHVVLTCVDAHGAMDTCTAVVTVADVTPPVLVCPHNATAECSKGSAMVNYGAPTVTDNCAVASSACVPPSGSTFPLGSTPVTCTATDPAGNVGSCGLTVSVLDTLPPNVTVGGGGELWPPNHQYVTKKLSDCSIEINDQCQGMIDLDKANPTIMCVTSDEPELGTGDGNTTNDIVIVNATTVRLRSERSGNLDGRVYKIRFRVTDAAGNVANAVCSVGVPHDQSGPPAVDSGNVAYQVGNCH